MFGLFVPLLDVLAILSDPEDWAELGQLLMHNLLLKSISTCKCCTSKCKELDWIPWCNAFAVIVLIIVFVLQGFLLSCHVLQVLTLCCNLSCIVNCFWDELFVYLNSKWCVYMCCLNVVNQLTFQLPTMEACSCVPWTEGKAIGNYLSTPQCLIFNLTSLRSNQ